MAKKSKETKNKSSGVKVSIFVKCLAVLAVATLVVAGALSVLADRSVRNIALDGFRLLAYEMTLVRSEALIGAVRFGGIDAAQADLEAILAAEGKKIVSAIVVGSDGTILARGGDDIPGSLRPYCLE